VELVHTISHRVAGFLEREGILEGDEENSYLNLEEGLEEPRWDNARHLRTTGFYRQVGGVGTQAKGELEPVCSYLP
jgi:hypothetical protein